jgi:hypothetical protein
MQKPSTKVKRKISKTTGIPTSSSGKKRKAQKAATGGGCLIPIILIMIIVTSMIVVGCSSKSKAESNQYYKQAVLAFEQDCDMNEENAKKATEIIDKCGLLTDKIQLTSYYDNFYIMQVKTVPYQLTIENGELTKVCTYLEDKTFYASGVYNPSEEPTATFKIAKSKNETTAEPTTEKPTEKPTEKITEPPTEIEVEEDYDLQVINWTNTVEAGSEASVTIQGKPNTKYSIAVFYHSGASDAKGLEPKTSDDNGYVTWTWKVGSRTEKDTYSIKINGDGKHEEIQFTVA